MKPRTVLVNGAPVTREQLERALDLLNTPVIENLTRVVSRGPHKGTGVVIIGHVQECYFKNMHPESLSDSQRYKWTVVLKGGLGSSYESVGSLLTDWDVVEESGL